MAAFPAMPRSRVAVGAVRPGGTIDFGTAVPVSFDGSHSFGLTGWFRVREDADTGVLIGKEGEFTIGVKGGRPYARLAGQLASVAAPGPLAKGWHFLAVTYETTGANSGEMSLFTDGGLAAEASLANVGAAPTSNPLLAGGGVALDVWCLCAFDRGLTPSDAVCEWTPMQDAAETTASFCFMKPPAKDNGPSRFPIAFKGEAAERVGTPGVSFEGNGYALAGQGDTTDISSGPYTVQAWIYPNPEPPEETQYVFAEGPSDSANVSLGVTLASGSLTLAAQHGADVLTGGQVKAGSWQNVAVTYDGTTLMLFLNGQPVGRKPSAAASLSSHTVALGAGPTSSAPDVAGSFQGTIQSVDVWSRVLSPTEIATFATRFPEEGVGEEEGTLVASYLLGPESSNLVSAVPVGLFGSAHADELMLPPPAGEADAPSVAGELDELALPVSDFRLDFDAAQLEQASRAFLDDLRANYKEPGADELIERASAEFEAQMQRLLETGLLPEGMVTVKREGDELVVYRFTATGAIEVDRLPATTPCQDWYVAVVVALLGGLLSIFGVPIPAGPFARAVQRWVTRYPNFAKAVAKTFDGEILMRSITTALKYLYDRDGLGTIIYNTFTQMSWWEFTFFVAALILEFLELIFPGPGTAAFVAFVVAKIASLVAQLYVLKTEMPEGCLGEA